VYSYDYGFFPKTEGGDGDETDVFIGPSKDAHMTFWAVQTKDDGEFDEFKVFVGFNSRKEAVQAYVQHIPRKYLKSMLAIPISMVKSMLGKKPLQKVASAAFFDELEKLGGA
jgi:inorganic pyrophosphatase